MIGIPIAISISIYTYEKLNDSLIENSINSLQTSIFSNDRDKLNELIIRKQEHLKDITPLIQLAENNEKAIETQINLTRKISKHSSGSFNSRTNTPETKAGLINNVKSPIFILKGNFFSGYSFELRKVYIEISPFENINGYKIFLNNKLVNKSLIKKESETLIIGPLIPGKYQLKISNHSNKIYKRDIQLLQPNTFIDL